MPYRKSYKKRRTYKKRTPYRRKRFSGKAWLAKPRSNNEHIYKVKTYNDTVITQLLTVNPGAQQTHFLGRTIIFRLDDVTNHTKFTQLYDQYKIAAIKLTFYPSFMENYTLRMATGEIHVGVAQLSTVIDMDDFTIPTAIEQVINRNLSHTTPLNRKVTRYLKPKVTRSVTDLASNAITIVPKNRDWIDCADPQADHAGLKLGVQIPTLGNVTAVENFGYRLPFQITWYLKFRHCRPS